MGSSGITLHLSIDTICNLQFLATLHLGDCSLSDNHMLSFLRLPSLLYLDLYDNNITDSGLEHLSQLSCLLELDISFNNGITDKGMYQLKSLLSLREIDISHCNQLTTTSLVYLSMLPSLNTIGIRNDENERNIPEEVLHQMQTLKKEWTFNY